MPTGPAVTLAATAWAVMAIIAVASALTRRFLAARAGRRELDRYLQWLLDDAASAVRITAAGAGRAR